MEAASEEAADRPEAGGLLWEEPHPVGTEPDHERVSFGAVIGAGTVDDQDVTRTQLGSGVSV